MNYHSRRPLISGGLANFTSGAIQRDLTLLGGAYAARGGITDARIRYTRSFP